MLWLAGWLANFEESTSQVNQKLKMLTTKSSPAFEESTFQINPKIEKVDYQIKPYLRGVNFSNQPKIEKVDYQIKSYLRGVNFSNQPKTWKSWLPNPTLPSRSQLFKWTQKLKKLTTKSSPTFEESTFQINQKLKKLTTKSSPTFEESTFQINQKLEKVDYQIHPYLRGVNFSNQPKNWKLTSKVDSSKVELDLVVNFLMKMIDFQSWLLEGGAWFGSQLFDENDWLPKLTPRRWSLIW